MTGYSSGMLNKKITVARRVAADGKFGHSSAAPVYEPVVCLWASVKWTKGAKSMREGAFDAYDTIMIRTRWTTQLTRDSYIIYDGKTYQIQSFQSDRQENIIQIVAIEIVK